MPDSGAPGRRHDLWALPSEELPPGAAVFLEMARDLEAALDDAEDPWIVGGRVVPEPDPGDPVAGQDTPGADPWPNLRLVQEADDLGGGEQASSEAATRHGAADDPRARAFLEMVDRAGTVRPLPSPDGAPEPAIAPWLWAGEGEDPSAADVLLQTIEQAIQHVNASQDIPNEELRKRLLDLFGDFAVRRPWKDEERPEAQRIQRLTERGPEQTG
jgi:hypothetical protein